MADGTIFHRHNSGSRDAHVVHFTSAFYIDSSWQETARTAPLGDFRTSVFRYSLHNAYMNTMG